MPVGFSKKRKKRNKLMAVVYYAIGFFVRNKIFILTRNIPIRIMKKTR